LVAKDDQYAVLSVSKDYKYAKLYRHAIINNLQSITCGQLLPQLPPNLPVPCLPHRNTVGRGRSLNSGPSHPVNRHAHFQPLTTKESDHGQIKQATKRKGISKEGSTVHPLSAPGPHHSSWHRVIQHRSPHHKFQEFPQILVSPVNPYRQVNQQPQHNVRLSCLQQSYP
jgi:hypothetical protein